MIVLSRKRNESLVINDDIRVTVVEIHGEKVRLGIEAPIDVPLHRGEVYQAIRGETIRRPIEDPDAIRGRIEALHRQIHDLQTQLPD